MVAAGGPARVVAVEEVAALLSRDAHARASMPDYTVTRVALDEAEGEEVWHVQPVQAGAHPGDCRGRAIRDPNVFWWGAPLCRLGFRRTALAALGLPCLGWVCFLCDGECYAPVPLPRLTA
jgi:hypothetical protein